uniref:Uncharacterized protein n=1 Tax=Mola mola TaxID=94237 RepID=A0A3Q3X9Y6_MOLML
MYLGGGCGLSRIAPDRQREDSYNNAKLLMEMWGFQTPTKHPPNAHQTSTKTPPYLVHLGVCRWSFGHAHSVEHQLKPLFNTACALRCMFLEGDT